MAPEEFVRGRIIDNITNVYTMGAAAFVFLADSSREREAWRGTDAQYEVCLKAVSQNREERYSCIAEFYRHWKGAS